MNDAGPGKYTLVVRADQGFRAEVEFDVNPSIETALDRQLGHKRVRALHAPQLEPVVPSEQQKLILDRFEQASSTRLAEVQTRIRFKDREQRAEHTLRVLERIGIKKSMAADPFFRLCTTSEQ